MSSVDTNPVCSSLETGNVEPLLHEIRHALKRLADGEAGTVIDLKRLPLAPGEEERIEETLGTGEVRAEVDALGPTIIQETSYPGVWLITHKNADGVTVRIKSRDGTWRSYQDQRPDFHQHRESHRCCCG